MRRLFNFLTVNEACAEFTENTRSKDSEINSIDHRVQFYDDDRTLCEIVAQFIAAGFAKNEAGALIATPAHTEGIFTVLASSGLDVATLRSEGKLITFDALDTLERISTNGRPDAGKFDEVIAGAVDSALLRYPRVRAFGEMVDILWSRGDRHAMLELERLWNVFLSDRPASLLCGYRMSTFAGDCSLEFEGVCTAHSHVLPVGEYEPTVEVEAQARRIAALQRKVATLEAELDRLEGLRTSRR